MNPTFAETVRNATENGLTPCLYFFHDQITGHILPANQSGEILSHSDFDDLFSAISKFYATTSDDEIEHRNRETHAWIRQQTLTATIGDTHKHTRRSGFIYLLRSATGPYKIGKSKDPSQRFHTIFTNSPVALELILQIETDDMHALERDLHQRFAAKRIQGEWFQLDDADLSSITR